MSPPSTLSDSTASADQARWFAEEVRPHEPQLRAFLHRQFPTLRDTDDLVQESYLKILKARQTGRIKSAKSYLFGIARNAALSILRLKRTTSEISVGEYDGLGVLLDDVDVFSAVCSRQELSLVVEAMDELPGRCREVLILWALEGKSQDEIAAHLRLSPHTVRAQLAKGVKRCVENLRRRGVFKETS